MQTIAHFDDFSIVFLIEELYVSIVVLILIVQHFININMIRVRDMAHVNRERGVILHCLNYKN